jgi:archaellum component FlaC
MSKLTEIKEKIDHLQKKLKELMGKFGLVKKEIIQIQGRVSAIQDEEKIADLKEKIDSL